MTRDDVADVLHRVLAAPGVLSVVGPFEADDPVLVTAAGERAAARDARG